MKYKDRHTLNSWNKQVDKLDEADSQRKRRRKLEREMINFTNSICSVIDKDWWDCVSSDTKINLYHTWQNLRYRNYFRGVNAPEVEFEHWAKEIQKTTKIDKALWREKKINKVLDKK